jgi:hypothetical protein
MAMIVAPVMEIFHVRLLFPCFHQGFCRSEPLPLFVGAAGPEIFAALPSIPFT